MDSKCSKETQLSMLILRVMVVIYSWPLTLSAYFAQKYSSGISSNTYPL